MTGPMMIDLFAGAGGLSAGLVRAGFTAVYANEFESTFAQTYQLNHPDTIVDAGDIRALDAREVRERLRLEKGELALLAGGPPCQGFSINAPTRRSNDARNHLFRDFLRFAEEFQPRAVLIENVPGLVSFEGGATLDAILTILNELGYNAEVKILYAPYYRVPQTRWRTFIVGMRDGIDPSTAFPRPLVRAPARVNFTSRHRSRTLVALPDDSTSGAFTTVADALEDLPSPASSQSRDPLNYATAPQNGYQASLRSGSLGVYNHETTRMTQLQLERLRHIPPGGNWTNIPYDLLPAGMKRARRGDHTKRYGRADPHGLSSTILTKCDPHWGAYFHYREDRVFTVREAARIQSFPDSYRFLGNRSQQYKQVGNAVPVLMAEAMGIEILRTLNYSYSLPNLEEIVVS